MQAARRCQREAAAIRRRPEAQTENPDLAELHQVLDEELYCLPKKYRMPLLLCCLEDQTIDEAAQQLGWSFATVKGRLQRGRELLRGRLQKRGIGLSAGVLGTILTQGAVRAVRSELLNATLNAAATGTMVAPVATLVKGAMQAMFWKKIKVGTLLVVFLTVAGVGPVLVHHHGAAAMAPLPEEAREPKKTEPKASEPLVKDGLEVVVELDKAVFAANESPRFKITYTSRNGKLLMSLGREIQHVLCLDLGNNETWKAGAYCPREAQRKAISSLEAGKSFSEFYILTEPVPFQEAQPRPMPARNFLPPGKYRLTAQVSYMASNLSRELVTNPVEFEIAAQAAVQPAQAAYDKHMRAGEVALKFKKYVDAVKEFEQALKIWPGNREAMALLKEAKEAD